LQLTYFLFGVKGIGHFWERRPSDRDYSDLSRILVDCNGEISGDFGGVFIGKSGL